MKRRTQRAIGLAAGAGIIALALLGGALAQEGHLWYLPHVQGGPQAPAGSVTPTSPPTADGTAAPVPTGHAPPRRTPPRRTPPTETATPAP